MTPEELDAALDTIGWSRLALAKRAGRSPSTVFQWATGATTIPADVAAWLGRLAAFHAKNPPPEATDRRTGPRDAKRLVRLRALRAEGLTLDQAAVRMKINPKTLRNFAARHRDAD